MISTVIYNPIRKINPSRSPLPTRLPSHQPSGVPEHIPSDVRFPPFRKPATPEARYSLIYSKSSLPKSTNHLRWNPSAMYPLNSFPASSRPTRNPTNLLRLLKEQTHLLFQIQVAPSVQPPRPILLDLTFPRSVPRLFFAYLPFLAGTKKPPFFFHHLTSRRTAKQGIHFQGVQFLIQPPFRSCPNSTSGEGLILGSIACLC